jgi:hypothetical protein
MIPIEKKMTVKERQLKALNLREMGFSYESIARLLKFRSARAAYNSVSLALQKTFIEKAEEFRRLEYAQLELLKRQYSPRAIEGDLKYMNPIITILERESKLLGLYDLNQDQDVKKNKKKERPIVEVIYPETDEPEE